MEPTALTGAAQGLTDLLLRPENLYLMVAVNALLTTFWRVAPKTWQHPVVVRLAPLYPLVLCSAGVWIPGQQPDEMPIGGTIIVGIILGWACGHLHKVWKQTVRGKDDRLKTPPSFPPQMRVVEPPPPDSQDPALTSSSDSDLEDSRDR